MSGPTLVIELAEPLSPDALREFRALMVGLSSHFDEKRPGFFDVNVPAERLGVEDRREEDWRKPFPLPLLGNTSADEELTALVVPITFRIQVSHQAQEYPSNSSRLSRGCNKAPRGAHASFDGVALLVCLGVEAWRAAAVATGP